MLASLKYLRCNFTPYSAHEALYETLCVALSFIVRETNCRSKKAYFHSHPRGTAHRTSEKQKPGPLDLALLFKEVLRVKRGANASISVRECLFTSVAEYNKKYGATKARFFDDVL